MQTGRDKREGLRSDCFPIALWRYLRSEPPQMKKGTWCAQFFDHWDDVLPSRVMIITANNEDEAVDKAASQMGNAARIEFARVA